MKGKIEAVGKDKGFRCPKYVSQSIITVDIHILDTSKKIHNLKRERERERSRNEVLINTSFLEIKNHGEPKMTKLSIIKKNFTIFGSPYKF